LEGNEIGGINASMIAVAGMAMTGKAAKPVIKQVARNNQQHGRNQQPDVLMNKKLLHHEQNKTCCKYNNGNYTVMMPPVTVVKRECADAESQHNHAQLKSFVFNDIDTKQRQAGKKQGQQGTMYGAGQGSRNAQHIPVNSHFHGNANVDRSNRVAKNKIPNFAPSFINPNPVYNFLKMNFSRKQVFYFIFFTGLVAVFYITLTLVVPGFRSKNFPPVGSVNPFVFTNQDGLPFTDKNVEGKVYVAEYFFTTCKGICPRMNNNMKTVYEKYKDENNFLVLSHTSDPDIDSPEVLKRYADSLGVNTNRWVFLTGRKDSLYNMARLSYQIDDPANNLKSIDDDFLHTQFWALVNKKGEVTKIYDGLEERDVKKLIGDIGKLLKDKPE
jgi:protein SCO1/2